MVVDVPEHSKEKVAHSVKIGVPAAVDRHTNSPQDLTRMLRNVPGEAFRTLHPFDLTQAPVV